MKTLIKERNVKLFITLNNQKAIKDTVKEAGLTVQHAGRLLKSWVVAGYLQKEKRKYGFTPKGEILCQKLKKMLE